MESRTVWEQVITFRKWRTPVNMEMVLHLSVTFMHILRNSLKGKTTESFNAVYVGKSPTKRSTPSAMWKTSTFQEVTSMSVTNVVKSLTPKTRFTNIVLLFITARSKSCFNLKLCFNVIDLVVKQTREHFSWKK